MIVKANSHDQNVFTAQVLLREARARRHQRSFHATLLEWAANARRRAASAPTVPLQFQLWPEDAAA
jgi:hypothetical protein